MIGLNIGTQRREVTILSVRPLKEVCKSSYPLNQMFIEKELIAPKSLSLFYIPASADFSRII